MSFLIPNLGGFWNFKIRRNMHRIVPWLTIDYFHVLYLSSLFHKAKGNSLANLVIDWNKYHPHMLGILLFFLLEEKLSFLNKTYKVITSFLVPFWITVVNSQWPPHNVFFWSPWCVSFHKYLILSSLIYLPDIEFFSFECLLLFHIYCHFSRQRLLKLLGATFLLWRLPLWALSSFCRPGWLSWILCALSLILL